MAAFEPHYSKLIQKLFISSGWQLKIYSIQIVAAVMKTFIFHKR